MTTARTRPVLSAFAGSALTLLLQDLTRDDVSATRHWVSHLSLGRGGRINIAALGRGRVSPSRY